MSGGLLISISGTLSIDKSTLVATLGKPISDVTLVADGGRIARSAVNVTGELAIAIMVNWRHHRCWPDRASDCRIRRFGLNGSSGSYWLT